MPVATAHSSQLSQRALLLSVGALALSVVAMTTMFVFVYSHGSGALESAAHQGGSRSQQMARAETTGLSSSTAAAAASALAGRLAPASALVPSDGHPPAAPLADAKGMQICAKRHDPLYRASVVQLSADGESGIFVQHQALQAASQSDDCN